MIHGPSSLRLLDALLAAGPTGAHREELLRQAEVSPATFYRAVEPWLAAGLVIEEGARFILTLSSPANFAFKLWRDQLRLLELSSPLREEVTGLAEQLKNELGTNLLALWLHGSIAQRTADPESDIDFLAVLRKHQEEEHVDSSRTVQVTHLSARHFSEDWELGDGFVRTVLQHGLLLYDRGFAQEYLAKAMPQPSPRATKSRTEMRDRIRSRLLMFVRNEAWPEACQALKSLAVSIGRSMLEPLGVVPAGKPDLLEALESYFGEECRADFHAALSYKGHNSTTLFRLRGRLEDWSIAFGHHTEHIQDLVAACSGLAPAYEKACKEMLEHLFGSAAVSKDNSADFVLDVSGVRWSVETKTSKGPLDGKLGTHSCTARPLLVIVNPLREVPLSRRPAFNAIQEPGVVVIDSRQLFQLHLRRLLLEPKRRPKPETISAQLFHLAA